LANTKIPVKDIAVIKEFREPLEWIKDGANNEFGKAAELLEECGNSDQFWE